jgi:hypothetical protein
MPGSKVAIETLKYLFAPSGNWMPTASPPEELVPGGDSVGWLFAYFYTLFAVLWGAEIGSTALLRALGVGTSPSVLGLVTQVAIVAPIAGLCAFLFVTYIPAPLPKSTISPTGLRVYMQLRPIEFPWSRVRLVGDRVYAFTRRGGVSHVYRANDYQVSRLSVFLMHMR